MSDAEQEVEQAAAENPEVESSAEDKVDGGKAFFFLSFFFFLLLFSLPLQKLARHRTRQAQR